MKRGLMSKVAAMVVFSGLGLLLATGCDVLGGGGEGGSACDGGYGGLGLGGGGSLSFGGGGGGPADDAQSADACFGKPATKYIDCRKRGLDADACSTACLEAGTGCGPRAGHPYKSGEGIGKLTWCKNGSPTYTCTYTFESGDACAGVFAPPSYSPLWICLYK
ncbi:MAG: hypothetical protein KDA22_14835 [Phycisphaerales bacterium]|nr:hypothetical protein [Phycisphaerales bacterium]